MRRISKRLLGIFRNRRVEELPLNKLTVDPNGQRDIVPKHVAAIVEDFHPLAIKPFHVSRRKDGTMVIIDGQQEWYVLQDEKIKWPSNICIVYEGLTRAEEANLFYLLNNVKVVQAKDKYRVLLQAKNPRILKIHRIVTSHGFDVQLGRGRPPANVVCLKNPGCLQRIYDIWKETMLDEILMVVRWAFLIEGTDKPDSAAIQDRFILGVAQFLSKEGIEAAEAIELLDGVNAEAIYDEARHECPSRGGQPNVIARLLGDYIKGHRRRRAA